MLTGNRPVQRRIDIILEQRTRIAERDVLATRDLAQRRYTRIGVGACCELRETHVGRVERRRVDGGTS